MDDNKNKKKIPFKWIIIYLIVYLGGLLWIVGSGIYIAIGFYEALYYATQTREVLGWLLKHWWIYLIDFVVLINWMYIKGRDEI